MALVAIVPGRQPLRLTRKSERASGKLTKWPSASRRLLCSCSGKSPRAVEEQLICSETMSRGIRRKKNLEECKAMLANARWDDKEMGTKGNLRIGIHRPGRRTRRDFLTRSELFRVCVSGNHRGWEIGIKAIDSEG